MTTLISFLVVLGILVFIHELGHFIIAKLSGVGVLKFSLGFGPKLIGIKRGETEYLISALPLGGYVKMVGESPGEEISPEDKEKSFTNKPVSKRAAIVVAGSIMNLVLAFVLLPFIYLIGIQVPTYLEKEAIVGYVVKDEAADKAGLENGDIIISIDDNQIKNWEELSNVIISNPNKSMNLKIKRDGEIMEIKFATEASLQTGGGVAGFLPPMSPIVGGLNKGFPADVAGLQIGDTIISVAGIKINHWIELQQAIQGSKGEGQQIFIKRGSETFDVNMKPQWSDDIKAYVIGISPIQETITRRYGPIGALIEGTKKMGELTIMTFVVIKKLFFGEISIKTLGGPLMIAQVAGQAAETGLTAFLSLMAFLSLQLGILNLLPIPVLDGGYLVFFGIEAMRGKPLSEKVIMVAQQIGIALLVLLMVFVTYNDILRLDIIGFVRGLVE
ncbi:MAG TPA: RIP metalloprotease RseP [Deltaproteobacteria bacterium]|nr:MAG: RIP metalloprotease RseP [Deltaproteobacteria bacterium GWD2_42_10]OGP47026.1 MAG: RIP metalloprotease RseP [Deltaproteobacteria bacterium GWF2_42_12]OGQ24732.1 MAG: RIP metalloprotease RseP [Deltaproteobacteria bacterium RIFCSPHIGHO2_02_FULL_42_44]OGQ36706.1 MAG: RIP metalloprotease RseP [Deltaproteobacteria bacterium RIFCSPLOWO2_02_FULL_42_39]OGQ66525.1 MAG: RIP metalloprotease RseP [Deltaproteobacteria bacterium RIFCSPLOWO2_12_FULL_42_16]OGQ72337.1 MAG: RIP metalloprotease RseP [Del